MLVIHGAAEHGGRYKDFAAQLARDGFAVATVDLPGHGKSPGKRCCVNHFDDYVSAVNSAHEQARRDFPDTPFFLVGHSMGGLVASLYVHRYEADFIGAIFSGAALIAEPVPSGFQVGLLQTLARFFPSSGILKLDANAVSRDPEVVTTYVNDPLVYSGKLTASMLVAMFAAMARAREGLPHISLPVLIMHGEADRLVPPKASRLLAEEIGSKDKTLRLYPTLFHEIFNEPEREEIVAELIDWAAARLPTGL